MINKQKLVYKKGGGGRDYENVKEYNKMDRG